MVLMTQVVLSVHLTKHHQTYDQSSYLSSLKDQQNQFETGIEELKGSVKTTDQQVASTSDIEEKISILEDSIIDQDQSIFDMSTNIIPPLSLSNKSCKNMSEAKKEELSNRTDQAIEKV